MNYSDLNISEPKVSRINWNPANQNQSEITKNNVGINFRNFKLNISNKSRKSSRKRNKVFLDWNPNRMLAKVNNNKKQLNLSNMRRNEVRGAPLMISKTIEHHDQTMIEEYTNTHIPEFTLGPDEFEPKIEPIKPHSVNRMGFYDEWKAEPISPIEKKSDNYMSNRISDIIAVPLKAHNDKSSKRLCNFRNIKNDPIPANLSDDGSDSDFYENQDIISLDTAEKWNVAKDIKFIDTIRNSKVGSELETPSFNRKLLVDTDDMRSIKFEDVLKKDSKCTQRSSNLFSGEIRCSSEANTHRRSSITRAESDNDESHIISSKREKSSNRSSNLNSLKYGSNKSFNNLKMPDFQLDPSIIRHPRNILRAPLNPVRVSYNSNIPITRAPMVHQLNKISSLLKSTDFNFESDTVTKISDKITKNKINYY